MIADAGVLGALASEAHAFARRATPEFRSAARRPGFELHDYDPDRELMLLRGPAIVEGASSLASRTRRSPSTTRASVVVVVRHHRLAARSAGCTGWGPACMWRQEHDAARGRIADGLDSRFPRPATDPGSGAPRWSSPPSRRRSLTGGARALPRGSLVLDIAPPPEHADLDARRELGHRAVWARGTGAARADTVGKASGRASRRYIAEVERTAERGAARASTAGCAMSSELRSPERRHRRRGARSVSTAALELATSRGQASDLRARRRSAVRLFSGKRGAAVARPLDASDDAGGGPGGSAHMRDGTARSACAPIRVSSPGFQFVLAAQ